MSEVTMKQTKKLHELIELANKGVKFRATRGYGLFLFPGDFFNHRNGWSNDQITACWEYEEIKDPIKSSGIVQWVKESNGIVYPYGDMGLPMRDLIGKKTKITIEEIVE